MRWCLLALCALLPGCHPTLAPLVVLAAADVATVAVFGHGAFDVAYSLHYGRDCSIVRLDKGKSYCRPPELPPPRPEFCARTLGVAECFVDPAGLADHPRGVADGPERMTPAQEKNRTAIWPF